MAKAKYTIGVDFGTESARAVLVRVADGKELAIKAWNYSNGVITEKLPGTSVRLEHDWALQDPDDYIRALERTIPPVLRAGKVKADDVIGIGIDFTACTMMPT
ncbi:MAG: ribulokinase, partial [Phycisphaerae bacterium]|nr:ribulokinase [Phycisphaerae bacterium]